MATGYVQPTGQGNLKAVELLVQGKTDSELLQAICLALTDNDDDLITKLMGATNYDQRAATNIQIAASIVKTVAARQEQS